MYNPSLDGKWASSGWPCFSTRKGTWRCVGHLQADYWLKEMTWTGLGQVFPRRREVSKNDPEALQGFDLIVPVYHKKSPIAFALVEESGPMWMKYTRIHSSRPLLTSLQ
jgi:hypothetical protein